MGARVDSFVSLAARLPVSNSAFMRITLCLTACFLLTPTIHADVEHVEIDSVSVVANGQTFGEAGAFEVLRGRIYFGLDPEAPANSAIVDLNLAPRNAEGEVQSWGDLLVLRPVEAARRNGSALLEVSNRGGLASLRYFQGAQASLQPQGSEHFGDGLLMRQGLTMIWVGWQFDVPRDRQLRLHVPFIREPKLSGLLRSDWVIDAPTKSLAVAHRDHLPYGVSDPGHEDNVLTVRSGRDDERQVVPRDQWSFAREDEGQLIFDPTRIYLAGGFELGKIYELVYRGQDPAVVGMGLAAIRDTMSFAKYDERCPFPVKSGVAVGISQTGRFLRHFLYQGFNTDEAGRQVYDGMLIHTAGAGRGSFNHRFAQPSRDGHRYSAFFFPTDIFPFSGRKQRDPVTGAWDGLLPEKHLPRIFYTNTGYEYWGRAASLLHTSLDGSADVEPLANERIYHLASCQHFPIGFPPAQRDKSADHEVWRGNPIALLRTERALLMRLFDWVREDVQPPLSAYPRIDQGTLLAPTELKAPKVPGLAWPRVAQVAYRANYGPRWKAGLVDLQPPVLGSAFPSLVSSVDEFGNESSGVRSLETRVPLATYAPWNLRTGMPGEQEELTDFYGSFAPLARNANERATGDSRPSIAETYANLEDYLERIESAAAALIEEGFLLEQDLPAALDQAQALWDWMESRP